MSRFDRAVQKLRALDVTPPHHTHDDSNSRPSWNVLETTLQGATVSQDAETFVCRQATDRANLRGCQGLIVRSRSLFCRSAGAACISGHGAASSHSSACIPTDVRCALRTACAQTAVVCVVLGPLIACLWVSRGLPGHVVTARRTCVQRCRTRAVGRREARAPVRFSAAVCRVSCALAGCMSCSCVVCRSRRWQLRRVIVSYTLIWFGGTVWGHQGRCYGLQ